MGLNIKDIIIKKEISIKDLSGKVLAVDSMNMLYQFLTTIRARDGSVFTNSEGKPTSHLIGLFNRATSFMEQGLKLIFVFDGKPPEIKQRTKEIRTQAKKAAGLKLEAAKKLGNIEEMRKYASRTSVLTREMVEDAKKLISYLGLPIVQAPSEGEAQTAYMVKKSDAYASVSQDFDNLTFGCPLLVRNLSIEGKRKKAGKFSYQTVKPEAISLGENLNNLGLDIDQLIVLAILIGTDYNPGGVKGIGPKKALKLIKNSPNNFDKIFKNAEWDNHFPKLEWKEIFYTIKKIPVTDDYNLEWKPIEEKKLFEFLIQENGFSEERVNSKLKKILQEKEKRKQTGLNKFF
jgi:flap endonuclease-1